VEKDVFILNGGQHIVETALSADQFLGQHGAAANHSRRVLEQVVKSRIEVGSAAGSHCLILIKRKGRWAPSTQVTYTHEPYRPFASPLVRAGQQVGAAQAEQARPTHQQQPAPRADHPCAEAAAVVLVADTLPHLQQLSQALAADRAATPRAAAALLELTAALVRPVATAAQAARLTAVEADRVVVVVALRLKRHLQAGMAVQAAKAEAEAEAEALVKTPV